MSQQRRFTRVLSWVFSCLLIGIQFFTIAPVAFAQTAGDTGVGDSDLPTVLTSVMSDDGSGAADVLLPDWDSISFNQMPPIQEAGAINLGQFTSNIGYDLSRTWKEGMTPDQYLKLGDISEALQAEKFSLATIADATGLDLNQVALSAFTLAAVQTVAELAETVPFLKELPIREIAPIASLLLKKAVQVDQNRSLESVLQEQPQVGEFRLGDVNLDAYSITSIPNLETVQLGDFSQWQNAFLIDVPGLGNVPLSQFPSPLMVVGNTAMRIDQVYGPAEAKRGDTISGSDKMGFSVPCQEKCAYIELDDLENEGKSVRGATEGKQWISGKYQEVEGGYGALGQINGGMEPTGRHPYGKSFKIVVWEPDETTDTVSTALFFRSCHKLLGCTPYFIGPVPFFVLQRDAVIFVGLLDPKPTQTPSTPTNADRSPGNPAKNGTPKKPANIKCAKGASSQGKTIGMLKGIHLPNLEKAIAARESSGDYAALGTYGCDQDGLCGRALGKYQFMNYNEYASNSIARKPGGQTFLDKVRGGYAPSRDEIMRFFPPTDQEQARRNWFQHLISKAAGQIDPQTGKPFTDLRLIERVSQMHYGGEYSPIDAGSTQGYGFDIAKRYQSLGGAQGAGVVAQNKSLLSGCVEAPKVGKKSTPPKKPTGKNIKQSTNAKKPVSKVVTKGKATGKYARPVDAPITSSYGWRVHPIWGDRRLHAGVDYGAPMMTMVRAANGGVVRKVVNTCTVGNLNCGGGYGNWIEIDHGNGRTTRYAHLVTNSVPWKEGNQVEKGQMVGRVGSTGYSTGSHLHFETRVNGNPVNPVGTYGL